MEIKTQRSVAYGILVVCLLVGVVCYAAFPVTWTEEPVRIMFKSSAGDVLFAHKEHLSDDGYGLECDSCHHEDADDPGLCSNCHDEEADVSRSDAFHGQCKGCHEEEQAGPVQCSECHVM